MVARGSRGVRGAGGGGGRQAEDGGRGSHRPHVVVVGGGFGGIAVVRALRKADVDITLVDRHLYNMFQPLLYQVATAGLSPGDVTYFLRALRYNQDNVTFRQGLLSTVDSSGHTITLADGATLAYDYLVIATGVTAHYFDTPGAREHSYAIYTRSQALAVRDRIFTVLESSAARLDQAAEAGRPGAVASAASGHGEHAGTRPGLRIVVVGGGATGVETAGTLGELRHYGLSRFYPELREEDITITVVQRGTELIKPFDPKLRAYAKRALTKRGVTLALGAGVAEVHADKVVLTDGSSLPADVVVWAAGVTAHSEVSQWGFAQGHGGRILVEPDMRVHGQEDVFAIGDIALSDADLPQLAQPAQQAGRHVGRVIADALTGRQTKPFAYRDKGQLATIGRLAAVAQIKGLPNLRGAPAWYVWALVHVVQLLGGRNRFATFAGLVTRYGQFWYNKAVPIIGEIRPVRPHGDRAPAAGDRPDSASRD